MKNRRKNHSILKVTLMALALVFITSGCESMLTNSIDAEKGSSDPNLNSNYLEAVSDFSDITATDKPTGRQKQEISVTILYDNYVSAEGLRSDWGFSCILQGTDKTILFDTGTNGELLLENMEKLKVNPKDVEVVVISHYHGDHTRGLFSFLEKNSDVSIYLPSSGSDRYIQDIKRTEAKIVTTDAPIEICKGVHLTGQMGEQIIEQLVSAGLEPIEVSSKQEVETEPTQAAVQADSKLLNNLISPLQTGEEESGEESIRKISGQSQRNHDVDRQVIDELSESSDSDQEGT